jgi:2-keto-4-pentenoate hydratase
MSEYSEHPLRPLSELEVFVGNILGKSGKQSKRQHDLSTTMKEQFEKDVVFIVNNIVKDGAEPSMEALERSVACFEVSLEIGRTRKNSEQLVSFKYVAAAVCLKEIERCSGGRLWMP